ncbi:uncharacterized protein [Littorina saxatilis]|uniref:Uncharacterized protein n=1 Tax=Littorina saxatilis TaxID=31220 RepID=A0AAN9AXB7_9CAEN
MDMFSDVDGVCPWMPSEMEDVDRGVWADGIRFESQFYDLDREPSFFSLSDLSDDLRGDRAAALMDLFKATRYEPIPIFQETMLMVDRLLLSDGRLPDNMTMTVLVAASYISRVSNNHPCVEDLVATLTDNLELDPGTELANHAAQINQMLGYFAQRERVHTPLDWLVRYVSQMPDVIEKQVVEDEIEVIVSVIGVAGSLAHHRPSTVAAAVLVHILEQQAEPYLCGYDLSDVATALAEIRKILDSCM